MTDTDHADPPDRVVILGGGIAGLAAADLLVTRGRSVIVLEASAQLGGMHSSTQIGAYTFDAGSIFYEDTARLFDLAPGLRDACPPVKRVQRRVLADGCVTHYPIEPSDLLRWPKPLLAKAIASMLAARLWHRRDGTLEGACVARLGKVLFNETGLRNYTVHFNGVEPSQIGEAFYDDRMRFVHNATELRRLFKSARRALGGQPFRTKPRPQLRIRPAAGYPALFDPIAENLRAKGVDIRTNAPVVSVAGTPGAMRVETKDGTFHAAAVVSAMPLDTLHRALFGTPSGLPSLDLLSLFVSARDLHPDTGTVLFNFHPDGGWKRATIYSRLYPDQPTDRDFFTVEITVPPGQTADPAAAFAAFERHVTALGLAQDLQLEGSRLARDAYPLIRPGQDAKVGQVLNAVTQAGIIPVGRQGRFKYLPTSTGVIKRVTAELADL